MMLHCYKLCVRCHSMETLLCCRTCGRQSYAYNQNHNWNFKEFKTLPKETFYMPISVAISTLWQIAWSSPPSKFLPLPQCLVGHESSNNLLQPKGISSIHQCGPLMFVSLSSSLDAFMMRIKRSKVWRWGYRFRFRQYPVELVQMLCEFHSWCYLKCILHFFKNRFVCILDSYLCAKLKG